MRAEYTLSANIHRGIAYVEKYQREGSVHLHYIDTASCDKHTTYNLVYRSNVPGPYRYV